MTWIDFFLYLSLLYVVYYAINVVIDVLRKSRNTETKAGDSYSFQTDLTEFDDRPTIIEDNDPEPVRLENLAVSTSASEELVNSEDDSEVIEINESNPIKSSGGVTNLNSLFVLAKEGTIEMKKKVVFT
ncbi:hypothetical protein [Algoriphagus persicinus]|uniref:hypothetical protein n=1 Tax=Algoriphagus persicinus TaxID=3108754 RepID=UPI002B3A91B0|nr:hypothetical protein [Algoriphagus sp. E1-3-M2]MEB2786545.1 hypothetical protein [Algoriphagus sp. E1-3-M2]